MIMDNVNKMKKNESIVSLLFNKCISVTNIVGFFYHRPQAHGFDMIYKLY